MRRLALALLLAAACDSVSSTEVTTSELGVFVWVDVGADGRADVTARLTTDNPSLLEVTYVRLEGGDALWASRDGAAPQAMAERMILGYYEYLTAFAGVAGGEEITVAFDRATMVDAPDTHVAIPAPIAIDASATTFARAAGVTLTWTGGAGATDAAIAVRDQNNCVDSFTRRVPLTTGQLALDAAAFVLKPNPPASCALEVEIAAEATGTADPAYGRGGFVKARQSRTLTLTMTP